MAVPAFFFVEVFRPLLPYGLGFAAGAMIWMVFSELVPDASRRLRVTSWLWWSRSPSSPWWLFRSLSGKY